MIRRYFFIAALFLIGCSNGAGEEVPENTPLPLEGNTIPQNTPPATVDSDLIKSAVDSVVSTRVNPFLTLAEEKSFGAAAGREVLTSVNVTAIAYSHGSSYAVLNGAIVKEGDTFDGKQIMQINKDNVILKDSSHEYIVNLNK